MLKVENRRWNNTTEKCLGDFSVVGGMGEETVNSKRENLSSNFQKGLDPKMLKILFRDFRI